jgi:hypothetical protein
MNLKCYLLFRPVKCTPSLKSRTVQDVCVVEKKKNEISIDDYLLNNTLLSFLSRSCANACVCVCIVVVDDGARDSVILVLVIVVVGLLLPFLVCYYDNYYSHHQNNDIILLITTIILLYFETFSSSCFVR